jgi:hypothetical protein
MRFSYFFYCHENGNKCRRKGNSRVADVLEKPPSYNVEQCSQWHAQLPPLLSLISALQLNISVEHEPKLLEIA